MSRFTFKVFCPRWGHDDIYHLDLHSEGWIISHDATGGLCDSKGNPYLYEIFRNDQIEYPGTLEWYMQELYERARDKTLSDEIIQERLDRLAKWVEEVTEVERPKFRILPYVF